MVWLKNNHGVFLLKLWALPFIRAEVPEFFEKPT